MERPGLCVTLKLPGEAYSGKEIERTLSCAFGIWPFPRLPWYGLPLTLSLSPATRNTRKNNAEHHVLNTMHLASPAFEYEGCR